MQKITSGSIDISAIIQEATEKAETPQSQLIGAAISRELTMEILLYDATDEQIDAVRKGIFEYNGNTYTAYAMPKTAAEKITVTAYDKMGNASVKYRQPGIDTDSDYTASDLWEDIASQIGASCDTTELGEAGAIVCKGKAKLDTHTMRDWVAWIAEAAGGNAIIQNDALHLKKLSAMPDITVEDASEVTETDTLTITKVKKYVNNEAITYGEDGGDTLYLTTGNPLITEELQVEEIYNTYSGLNIVECTALKTWIPQTASINIGNILKYNEKGYIITGYTRTHHGQAAEDSLELKGSAETNATRGEKSTTPKSAREAGNDGYTYTPDSIDNSGTSGGGSGSGSTNVKANELLTDGDPHWHIYNGANELVDGSTKRLTIGQDEMTSEDGEELVYPEKVVLISYDPETPIRVTKMDNYRKTVAKLDGHGNVYLGGDLDMVDNEGTTANCGTLRVDAIECRTLQLKSWPYTGGSSNPPAGLNVLYKGSGMTGWLKTPYGRMYFAMGILCAVDPDTRSDEMEFVEES